MTTPMRAPTNRTQETSPANFHDSVKRKLVNSVKKSKTYGGRFIANRKASRLDLDPKQCGPTGVKFVRGTVQCDRKKESCSPEFEGSARTVGVCQSGAAYRLAAATMLLQLGSDTDELCDQLDASRRDDTPTPHHYASRVLRFQDQASPDSVLQAPSAASSGPAVSRALFSQHRTGLSPVNMATQRFLSNGYAQHRFINEKPYRNLDAPGLADDFYRSPLDWRFVHVFFFSCCNACRFRLRALVLTLVCMFNATAPYYPMEIPTLQWPSAQMFISSRRTRAKSRTSTLNLLMWRGMHQKRPTAPARYPTNRKWPATERLLRDHRPSSRWRQRLQRTMQTTSA